jgi:hypothetical protein
MELIAMKKIFRLLCFALIGMQLLKLDKENFDVSNEGPPYQSDVFSIAGVEKFFFFLGTWVEG